MAFNKPTKLPEWASTTANVVEPSEGKKDDGWLVNEIPPSSYENWRAKTNWQWWQWIDEKMEDGGGTDPEKIQFQFPVLIDATNTGNPSEVALTAPGYGPKAIGVQGETDTGGLNASVSQVEQIGVSGVVHVFYSGKTPSSQTGVLGIGEAGVIGLGSSSGDLDTSVFDDVGVSGVHGAFTGSISDVGVFGFSSGKSGVLGIGGAGSIGSATISDCGIVGVGNGTVPTSSFSNIGVLGAGDPGGYFLGIGPADVGVEALGGSGGTAGRGATITGGNATSGAGGTGALIRGGDSTSAVGGIGIDVIGGDSGSGFSCGIGVYSVGGSLASRDGGRGGEFRGGSASSDNYDGGDGLYAKGGVASGASNTKGGYGAVLEGSDASAVAARVPLRLVPSTVDPPAGDNEAGAMYAKGGKLYYHNGSIWKEIAFV